MIIIRESELSLIQCSCLLFDSFSSFIHLEPHFHCYYLHDVNQLLTLPYSIIIVTITSLTAIAVNPCHLLEIILARPYSLYRYRDEYLSYHPLSSFKLF